MGTQSLSKGTVKVPSVFDDFFKPWNEWFEDGGLWGRTMNVPAVNITEDEKGYQVSLAAPGLKKEDFKIAVDGTILTISSSKEDTSEDREERFTRKEYNYASFSRSFTLPDGISMEQITANYGEGVLKISLPKKESIIKQSAKQIAVN